MEIRLDVAPAAAVTPPAAPQSLPPAPMEIRLDTPPPPAAAPVPAPPPGPDTFSLAPSPVPQGAAETPVLEIIRHPSQPVVSEAPTAPSAAAPATTPASAPPPGAPLAAPDAPRGPVEITLNFEAAAGVVDKTASIPVAQGPAAASPTEIPAPFNAAAVPPASGPVDLPTFEAEVPEEQLLKAAVFFPSGVDSAMKKFLNSLTEIAQKKAKKPIFIRTVLSQVTPVNMESATEWIWTAKSAGAECFFVILPPDMLPDFMESAVTEARQAGLHCFLVPQGEIVSRLLYVDLMVELMLIKRKK